MCHSRANSNLLSPVIGTGKSRKYLAESVKRRTVLWRSCAKKFILFDWQGVHIEHIVATGMRSKMKARSGPNCSYYSGASHKQNSAIENLSFHHKRPPMERASRVKTFVAKNTFKERLSFWRVRRDILKTSFTKHLWRSVFRHRCPHVDIPFDGAGAPHGKTVYCKEEVQGSMPKSPKKETTDSIVDIQCLNL